MRLDTSTPLALRALTSFVDSTLDRIATMFLSPDFPKTRHPASGNEDDREYEGQTCRSCVATSSAREMPAMRLFLNLRAE